MRAYRPRRRCRFELVKLRSSMTRLEPDSLLQIDGVLVSR